MSEFLTPQSRNEAILQNICGANNVLPEPQSRIEKLLQAILYEDETIVDFEPESRAELLLYAILTHGEYDAEPQSRNEEILKAILTGGEYDALPQSRIEALLIEWLDQKHQNNYGFHINSNQSDPYECVTYIADAVGKTPAHMDYANDTFIWGSWENAFFMPRPCMLKYDGTVDYYLDPNDYSKKEDGTASDVSDFSYPGNAMMEWGQNGKKIWYKIVPDSGPTSASVYIASYQADEDYRAWSFINNQGNLVDHFYTPIYNGTLDTNGKLRSISGKGYSAICRGKTAAQEITAAELNNPSTDKLWYTEVYADITLINLLLILISKSLASQAVFGNGVQGQVSAASSMISTGTMNDKGLFYGANDNTHGVKVFGMENWWGNQNRRFAGLVMNDYVTSYKMTRGRQDGTTADDYNTSGSGYLAGITCPNTTDYVKKMQFGANCFLPKEVTGTSSTYWCDSWYRNSGARYALRGGSAYSSAGGPGAFCVLLSSAASVTSWSYGAAPSCKPTPSN